MKKVFWAAVMAVLAAGSLAQATVPQLINYQGSLNDTSGPVTGTKSMVVSLYTVSTSGSAVWSETQDVTVTNGAFAVVLGSVTQLPASVLDTSEVWLGITVAPDADEMTPRQRVVSTGYAMRAGIADSLASFPVMTATNQIISSVSTGSAPFQVASTTVVPNLNADMVDGQHASAFLAKTGGTLTGTLTLTNGNIELPATGAIMQGGGPLVHSPNGNFFAGIQAGNVTMTGWANTGLGPYAFSLNAGGHDNTATGMYALYGNNDGVENTATGVSALMFNLTGSDNTAAGFHALYVNSTGNWNTAMGASALSGNGTGSENTALGARALVANSTGSDNTATGFQSLYSNSSGTSNTANGANALSSNTTGHWNTASGADALYSNSDGSENTATGTRALYSNTTGYENTASGAQSLSFNTTGYDNTGTGYQTLYFNTTGYDNTATGYQALYFNTTGRWNTATGEGALYSNTEGVSNTASGTNALGANTTGRENTANGVHALIANTEGWWNTASGHDALDQNTTGGSNAAFGKSALFYNTTGSYNTACGSYALSSVTTGTGNTAIGYFANVSTGVLLNATAIGYNAAANASNKVRIGNALVTVIEGQVGWSAVSDVREKRDIEAIGYGVDLIRKLRPVQYRLKQGNGKTDFGFIAQEIEMLLGDQYNVLGIGQDEDRTLSLRYTDFIAPMVKAIQEQQEIIEAQNAELDAVKARLATIESLLQK